MRGRRILLVEDDCLVGMTIAHMLRRSGAECIWVGSYEEAMHKVLHEIREFQVLVCDFNLCSPRTGLDVVLETRRHYGSHVLAQHFLLTSRR